MNPATSAVPMIEALMALEIVSVAREGPTISCCLTMSGRSRDC